MRKIEINKKIPKDQDLVFFIDSAAEAALASRQRNWRRKVPVGYPNSPSAFKKMTSLLAVVFAYYYALFLEDKDPATYRFLSFYCSPSETEQNEVGVFIEKQLAPFLHIIPSEVDLNNIAEFQGFILDHNIPYCTFKGEYKFSAQIHIFHKKTGGWLESYPYKYDDTKRQLYFLGEYCNAEILNLDVILDLKSFFTFFGYFCFYCKKRFKSRKFQHMCKVTRNCFACRRPIQTPITYVTKQTSQYFCDSAVSLLETVETCTKCNMRTSSALCKKFHLKNVCHFGWSCVLCKQYSFKNKFFPNHESLARNHICGQKNCFLCGKKYLKNLTHACPLLVPVLPLKDKVTLIGFLDCQVVGQSEGFCRECLLQNCDFCNDNNENYINVCSVMYEKETHGNFHYKIFADFSFDESEVPLAKEVAYCYLLHKSPVPKKNKNSALTLQKHRVGIP